MPFKKLLIVFAAFALVVSSCSKSVDDIIEKNIKARGGEDNIRKVKSVVVDARISSMGMDIPMKIYIQDPNKMRVDMNLLGQDVTTVYDGNRAG
jgi:outer membrane lipoprotein-sorting protein